MDKVLLAVKIVITVLVAILFVQNIAMVEVRFLTWSLSLPLAVLLVVIYLLGMISGKSLMGWIWRRRAEPPHR